jgi:type IV pilus assembly protein PilM
MSQKKAVIVNLAASSVSFSRFSLNAGRLVLEACFTEEIAPGLTADEEWLNAAQEALANLVSQHDLKGQVTVVAPAFLLLQKPLKVPQVEKDRQAQIVAFEAQNAIPYPLNEVIWDSQLMASDGVEAEVLLFALRADVAARIARLVTATGLRPMTIQAAPLLDSQAFQLAGSPVTEEVLIVNVGARSTTLSFVGPGGVSIQTAANMGGNLLTQGLSDNTGQSFATSEAIKIGHFTGVLQLAESDTQVALLQANAQAFIRRLTQDINRRLINVRRGANPRQPTRILLTGRASQVPGLIEQLGETLRLPVEAFDPTTLLAAGPELSAETLQRAQFQLTEVIGEAARLVLPQLGGVNLIPRDIAAQQAFDARKPGLLVAAALAAAAPLLVWFALNDTESWNNDQVKVATASQNELASRRAAILQSRNKALELSRKSKELESVVLNRSNWPAFLGDLQARVGECKNTWIEDLHVKYETTPAPAPEAGQPPAPPVVVTKVVIGVRFLFADAPFDSKQYRSASEKAYLEALLKAVRKSPYVAAVPESEISVTDQTIRVTEKTEIRMTPKATITLVIHKDKVL